MEEAAEDGTLEERVFYCQSWRADISVLVDTGGDLLEWRKYSAYGTPFGLPGGDTDSDGDCDSTDVTQVQSWINASAYDLRGDVDLDGDVDAGGKSLIEGAYEGTTLGREHLSASGGRRGQSGQDYLSESMGLVGTRARVRSAQVGGWLSRDPIGYGDGLSLYQAVRSNPAVWSDPSGYISQSVMSGSALMEVGALGLGHSVRGLSPSAPLIGYVVTVVSKYPYPWGLAVDPESPMFEKWIDCMLMCYTTCVLDAPPDTPLDSLGNTWRETVAAINNSEGGWEIDSDILREPNGPHTGYTFPNMEGGLIKSGGQITIDLLPPHQSAGAILVEEMRHAQQFEENVGGEWAEMLEDEAVYEAEAQAFGKAMEAACGCDLQCLAPKGPARIEQENQHGKP